jgi:hypothetical protein
LSEMINQPPRERSFKQDFTKYFIHGVLYSVLAILGSLLLSFIGGILFGSAAVIELVTGSAIMGWILVVLIIGIVFFLSMVFIGFSNVQLSKRIWKTKPAINFKSLFGHGGVLTSLIFLFGIPTFIIDYFYPNPDILILIGIAIPRFIVYAVVYGYIGRFVGIGYSDVPISSGVVSLGEQNMTTREKIRTTVLATPDLSTWQVYEKGLKDTLPRYLVHGVLYVLLMLAGSFIIVLLMIPIATLSAMMAVVFGSMASDFFAISIVVVPVGSLVFFLLGTVNIFLSKGIWKMDSPRYWKSIMIHGILLFLMLFLSGIPGILLSSAAIIPGLVTTLGIIGAEIIWSIILIIRIGLYLVIYGFIGRFVASCIKTTIQTEQIVQNVEEFIAECPNCYGKTQLHMDSEQNSKVISCTKCGTIYDVIRPD